MLVIAPGDLVPVDSVLLASDARISTDWITGEPGERAVLQGESLPAGAFNAGREAVRVRTTQAFTDSPLVALLRRAPPIAQGAAPHSRFWEQVSRRWGAEHPNGQRVWAELALSS